MDDRTVIRPMPGGRRPKNNSGNGAASPGGANPPPQNPSAGQQPYQPAPPSQPYQPPTPPGQPYQPPASQGQAYQPPAQQHQPYQPPVQGGAYQAPQAYAAPQVAAEAYGADQGPAFNPVLSLVTPLLTLISKMRNVQSHPDINEFHRYACDQINFYQSSGWGIEASQENAHYISYALCALVDEVVQNTPWGLESDWGQRSLLITFHQEAWGGKKFFQYLQQFMQRPGASIMLLEVYYCCLSLGFEGEYRGQNNGRRDLDILRDDVYVTISRQRNLDVSYLSPAWQGVSEENQGIMSGIPHWLIWSIAAALLMSVYIGFNWMVNKKSDALLNDMAMAARQPGVEAEPLNLADLNKPLIPEVQEDLKKVPIDYLSRLQGPLKPEIDQGIVEIIDEEKLTRLRIRHGKLFPSGQAKLSAQFEPLIEKIAQALNGLDKTITIVGHSDNVPIFSGPYPSNWALSTARAESVQGLLQAALPGVKTRSEGLADTEPLVANNSAANRALNRRVEVLLRK